MVVVMEFTLTLHLEMVAAEEKRMEEQKKQREAAVKAAH
jgi:hypothetical protein